MFKSYVIKIKNYILPFAFLLFTISLIVFSKSNLIAAKTGFNLFINNIIPSLFPFFVATELLSYTNFANILGIMLNNLMKPLFNVRGEGSFALILGIISGYPVGAKIACDYRKNNICSKEECERLLSFTNNSGPLFIIGTVGISLYKNTKIGYLLLITHILASLTVGIIFRFWKKQKDNFLSSYYYTKKNHISNDKILKASDLGKIISESITSSISTVLTIGGFVILFSVIVSIIKESGFLFMLNPLYNFFHISNNVANSLYY